MTNMFNFNVRNKLTVNQSMSYYFHTQHHPVHCRYNWLFPLCHILPQHNNISYDSIGILAISHCESFCLNRIRIIKSFQNNNWKINNQ